MPEAEPIDIRQTADFTRWLATLRDISAGTRILARIRRLSLGNPGDAKSIGGVISELRIDYGPGYRLYFTRRGNRIVLLLCGGDKSTQRADIVRARALAAAWEPDDGA